MYTAGQHIFANYCAVYMTIRALLLQLSSVALVGLEATSGVVNILMLPHDDERTSSPKQASPQEAPHAKKSTAAHDQYRTITFHVGGGPGSLQ